MESMAPLKRGKGSYSERKKRYKRYLINYPHLFDNGQTIFLSFFSVKGQSNRTRAIWTILIHRTCSLSTKNTFRGRNQIRRSRTTILQLLICVQHKMAGDDYPFILQCLVYRKKGYSSSLGDTHPSLKLPSFYVCWTSTGPLLGYSQISWWSNCPPPSPNCSQH